MAARRSLFAIAGALLAAQCASTPPPAAITAPTTPVVTAPTPVAEPEPDLSAVPAPEGLLAVVRVPSPRAMVRRLSEHFGIGDQLVELLDSSFPDLFNRDAELARAVNLDAPFDLAILRGARGRPKVVVSFTAGAYTETLGRLSEGHEVSAVGASSQRVRRLQPRRGRSLPCAVAPSAAPAGSARIVCAEDWDDVPPVVDYLTRTLPASPVTREAGEVVVEVSVERLREALRADARASATRLVENGMPRPDPNNPAFESSARDFLREVAEVLPQALEDLGAARATLSLPDEGLRVTADVSLARVGPAMLRRWLDAVAHPDARAESLARLPPGALAYVSGSAALEPMRATLNLGAMAAARALVPTTRLIEPEGTVLRTAVSALFAQDRVGGAAAVGLDEQGRYWNVSVFQPSQPGLQFVANARQLFSTLRRPLVARALRLDHHIDPMRWTLPTVPGLPRGSLYIRVPPGQWLWSGLVRDLVGDMSQQAMEVLLVPDGASVWYVVAPDALARYRAAAAAHPAPVAVSAPAGEGTVAVAALMPIAASLFFPGDAQFRRNLSGLLQRSADHGATPIAVRAAINPQDNGARGTVRVDVPRSVLGIVGQVFNTLQGGRP
jgi:hypothetical protein